MNFWLRLALLLSTKIYSNPKLEFGIKFPINEF